MTIPKLSPGQYAFVPNPDIGRPSDLLFVRKRDGTLDVWYMPKRDGLRALPDYYWWRPWGALCKDFAPDFERGIFSCNDPELDPYWKNTHWSLDGKSVDPGRADDMLRIKGHEHLGDFVLGEPHSR